MLYIILQSCHPKAENKENIMPLRTFNPSEIAKLKQLMNEGIQVTGEVEALRDISLEN